ncbi:MAG: GlxA family transcriptional regulator, partial [Candidatus Sericytochromatia bacterium]
MKTVSILVLETAVTTSIMDAQYMFSAVNGFFSSSGKEPYFDVKLVGLTKEVKLNNGLVTIHPDLLIKDIKKTDLIIIPAIGQDINEALKKNQDFIPWIINQHKNGSEVASLCIGAFLLASTGLLKDKYCSTHWLFANEFRSRFPDVKLTDDKVITEQNGLYSSGGATSYWNLLLYLVEKYTSREMAIIASKYFLLDIEKNTQLPFSMFKGQKEHGDELILAVQEFVEEHFQDKLTVDEIANRFGLGRRTFERRFKKVTSNTIIEYIQRIKIEIAKKQLENGRKTVNEVMYYVGYNDTKAFREVFKKITG